MRLCKQLSSLLTSLLCLLTSTASTQEQPPPLPWEPIEKLNLEPGQPGADFTPVVIPNGQSASYTVREGKKIFHLTAEPVTWEVADGLTIEAWGYNGSIPGPLIELAEGDQVRIYVTNKLPAPTSVHWHGLRLPCGMDGVSALTQPAIPPGDTFVYEFTFPHSGTFMYHPHFDNMTQEGMGLTGMIIVHERQPDQALRPDRDFAILLHEWQVNVGASRPNPFEMSGFNILTMNGKVMPSTEPLVAKLGDKVWIRYGNLSAMDHHPIHLHGYAFHVIGSDGGWLEDRNNSLPETTVLVPVGATRVIEFLADNPGDWIFHCHMTHHTMNQMGHNWPNTIGVDISDLAPAINKLIPGFMPMGEGGMGGMARMHSKRPKNSIPMKGLTGQFGKTVLGGMANILRVRSDIKDYSDPGPYSFPKGTVAGPASQEKMERDGIFNPK